jgi:hypothetical protein
MSKGKGTGKGSGELDKELDAFDKLFGKIFSKLDTLEDDAAELALEKLEDAFGVIEESITIGPNDGIEDIKKEVVENSVNSFLEKMGITFGSDDDFFGFSSKTPKKQDPDDPDFIDITINK